jgi:hypothetical protein
MSLKPCIARAALTLLIAFNLAGCSARLQAAAAEAGSRTSNSQLPTDHWAFRPPQRPVIPAVSSPEWTRNPIDKFILARLAAQNLGPAPEADRTTLIRRLSLDLLGLPPTLEEIEAFRTDKRADAYERLVDRFLDSPHYGERSARFWLDLARFCESHGFEYDKMRENAWPYRDYVIRSFNSDKPYVQFVREQIAGDVLEPVTRDGIVATTFLVAGAWDEVGNNQIGQLMKSRVREEELEDIIAAVGQTFLGVTINCARCHAHKFDPIPHSDYYRIKAVFEGVRYGDRSMLTPGELQVRSNETARLNRRINELEARIGSIELDARQALLQRREVEAASTQKDSAHRSRAPVPLAMWTFDAGAKDSIGSMHGELVGGASITNGRLVLNGRTAYLRTVPLAREIREKTLEVSLKLSHANQRGGGAISIEDGQHRDFDAIVFGERQSKKWSAGSGFFRRTMDLAAAEETSLALIHMTVVYRADNSIAIYRNGVPYAAPYTPSGDGATLQSFSSGSARVLIGLRHTGAGNGFLAGEIEEARLYDKALMSEEVTAAYQNSPASLTRAELLQALTGAQRSEHESLLSELKLRRESLQRLPPVPLAYAGTRQQPPPTHRLLRGDVESKAELVSPGALSMVRKPSPEFGLPAEAPEGERRRKFAEWIASPENPLTARVMVNRIWQQHFGVGLVGTASDFGLNGERPSHPELLDWLAIQFMERGWSIKHLHRLMLTSSTYRQSSKFNAESAAIDAENRLLWHFAPRRLEGEVIRDSILSVSGQLNSELGGPSFRPFDLSSFGGSVFYTLTDRSEPQFNRRTIYRMNINSGKSPLLDAFDCPDPSVKVPSRRMTTTPLQALGLMNNSFVQRQAKNLAARVQKGASQEISDQINLAYRLAFGREPGNAEVATASDLARHHGMESVAWVLLNASEFLYLR